MAGAIIGFFVWIRWDWRFRVFFANNALDSWLGLALVAGGAAAVCAAFAACLKERFWDNWRCPFWWS
jgi:hypothetical protein